MSQLINWSFIVALVLLLTCVFYLQIGIVTLKADKSSPMRRAYMCNCITIFIWSGCYTFMTGTQYYEQAYIFWAIGYISSVMVFAAWLHLVNELVGEKFRLKRSLIYQAYIFTFVIGIISVFSKKVNIIKTDYGFQFYFSDSLLIKSAFIIAVLLSVITFILLFKWWKTAVLKRDKKLALTFLTYIYLICPLEYYFDFISPIFLQQPIIPMTSPLMLLVSIKLFSSIMESSGFSITVQNAADMIFKAVNLPVFILNEKDEVVIASEAAQKYWGNFAGGLIGTNLTRLITIDDCLPDRRFLENEFSDILVESETAECKKYCSMTLTITYDKYGDVLHKVAVLRDITAMQRALHDARDASRAKTDFLSRMSHEIRTPMNAIIGMTKIGQTTTDITRMKYCLDKINDASTHLLGIINDILDMSKIEADKLDLTYDTFSFHSMIENVCGVVAIKAEEKHINFIIDVDTHIPKNVIGDELRISQVITNLLSNAIKFTPEKGTIELIASLKQSTGKGESVIKIEVKDTGIGIDEVQQRKLFTSFEQADGSIARRFGGTGLGLAISKRIVDLMGGELGVTSETGKGSTFHFSLKLKHVAQNPKRSINTLGFQKIRVLVVDDAPEIRAFFDRFLSKLGTAYDIASNGYEAIEFVKKAQKEGEPYSILFVDYLMHDLNGVQTVKRLREYLDISVPVIMVSVYEWSLIEKEAIEAGITRYLQKPLFSSSIFNIINEVANDEQITGFEMKHAEEKSAIDFKHNTILLAEDIEINREIVTSLLEDTQVVIDCAEDGQKVIDMFKANPHRYDLILMDIQMPLVDGLEATRKIRNLDSVFAKNVPILAMTANAFKEDVDACIMAGMNDHIGKPIDINQLMAKLIKYLPENPR